MRLLSKSGEGPQRSSCSSGRLLSSPLSLSLYSFLVSLSTSLPRARHRAELTFKLLSLTHQTGTCYVSSLALLVPARICEKGCSNGSFETTRASPSSSLTSFFSFFCSYVYSLDGVTTWQYLFYATSAVGAHALSGTVTTAG